MDYLYRVLNEDAINNIIETFDSELLKKLDSENIIKIIEYLKLNHINFIEDILSYYTDLFTLEASVFIKRFETLKKENYPDFISKLGLNLNLLESMWDYE